MTEQYEIQSVPTEAWPVADGAWRHAATAETYAEAWATEIAELERLRAAARAAGIMRGWGGRVRVLAQGTPVSLIDPGSKGFR
jgi:hypothetical protein